MIRKTIIVVLTLAAVSTTVIWFKQLGCATFALFPDWHYMGFAMIHDRFNQSVRILNYGHYPSVAIPVQWQAYRQYNLLIIPLWSLLVVFWCYPIKAFLHRAKKRRYVEREWFAVAAGMLAFAISALAVMYFIDSNVYRKLERLTGSDDLTLAAFLILLVVVSAISAIATHRVFAGPLRRASLRKPKMCLNCGYNLTGLTENRCPECATEFERT